MASSVFALPLENEEEEKIVDEHHTLLNMEKNVGIQPATAISQTQGRVEVATRKPPSFCERLSRQIHMIKWHILLFFAIFVSLYAVFVVSFNNDQKVIILEALTFFDDWRPFVFIMGIYCSFSVKKVSDVTSFIPPTDKIANLVSFAVKESRVQRTIMRYVCSAIGMVFAVLSPMVQKRLSSSETNIKAKLEWQSQRIIDRIRLKLLNVPSCHFMPLKWALHVINEAHERGEIESRYLGNLVNEINSLHNQCDRLVSFKHENFSLGLTIAATAAVYSFFVIGTIRYLWNALFQKYSVYILVSSLTVKFVLFLAFLLILRNAQQIVLPYNDQHDVFELNRILDEKLEVASFVLDKKCDLRKEIKNKALLP